MNKMILVMICMASLIGCGGESDAGVSSDDIGGLTVAQRTESPTTLLVSGLLMESGLGVHDHVVTEENDAMQITLETGKPDATKRAKFSFIVDVPDNVTVVTFGTDSRIVWAR
uniref:hypothetical protein n=1 Tax=Thaumasiovibrio occultus TaxID=1891184 RepID=UPI000B34AA86|nr:hypothetical protein [Thaumasiovibrio occultus]